MADRYWKTGTGLPRRELVRWPSLVQILRQVDLTVLIAVLWGGLLFGFLQFTIREQQVEASSDVAADSAAVEVVLTNTSTALPTYTATPSPTLIPTNPPTPADGTTSKDPSVSSTDVPVSIEPYPNRNFHT